LAAAALVVVVQEEVGDWLLVVSFWYLFASLCNFFASPRSSSAS